ncbi:MAG TPA: phospholipase D family protein [Oculatellaceae cyanobacterium]
MTQISFLKPIDAPLGNFRLLHELNDCLKSVDYSRFIFAVGFAKIGPLIRLNENIESWTANKKSIEAIFGIDQQGTSKQALEYALIKFDRTFVTHVSSSRRSTFHPKLYIFYGSTSAVAYYGSHNLTVGGTETNFEGGVKIRFDLSANDDKLLFDQLLMSWTSLLPENCSATVELTPDTLTEYIQADLLLDEQQKPAVKSTVSKQFLPTQGSAFKVRPPSSVPVKELSTKTKTLQKGLKKGTAISRAITSLPLQSLVIQIVPHHNGEVFLSKNAITQDPEFFGYPFTGKTVPKKSTNPSYPQRSPDPIVNINLHDEKGKFLPDSSLLLFPLNMVLYEKKSEIRITVPPELARRISSYSILVMSKTDENSDYDYDMDIYLPGSEQFKAYFEVCNQVLPSGGAAKSRKMGWL